MKGAPQVLIKIASSNQEEINKVVEDFAKEGKRSLLIAIEKEGQIKIVGLLTFFNFPRSDSKMFIKKINDMGISVKMLTGDNILIAKSIAESINIGKIF